MSEMNMKSTAAVKEPEGFNQGKFPLKKRELGGMQPYIPLGPFQLRLPLIHHRWSWTEMAAAMFLGVACLGAGTATTMTTFGLDEAANIAALGLTENGAFLMSLTFGVMNPSAIICRRCSVTRLCPGGSRRHCR